VHHPADYRRFGALFGIKIHETRLIRLMEVLLHGGTQVGGWTAKEIREAALTTFGLSAQRSAIA
jgi:hypothetical protein